MITYKPLWETMKNKNISTYKLINEFHFSKGTLDNLKHDRNVNTKTINDLCNILECDITDIMKYAKD